MPNEVTAAELPYHKKTKTVKEAINTLKRMTQQNHNNYGMSPTNASALLFYIRQLEAAPKVAAPIIPSLEEGEVIMEIGGRNRNIDASIAPIVDALNKGGITTVACCSGHGNRPGNIALADGRELIIAKNFEEGREIDRRWPDINGNPPMVAAPDDKGGA